MFRRKNKIKATKRQRELIEDFEKGKVLQVDNGIDNKEHFDSFKDV